MKTTEQIGTAIRTRRKQLKITQKELAMACGTARRCIDELERGKPTCQTGKKHHVWQALEGRLPPGLLESVGVHESADLAAEVRRGA